jgi:hypothetical protein
LGSIQGLPDEGEDKTILLAHIRQHVEAIGCTVAYTGWTPRLLMNFDQVHSSHDLVTFLNIELQRRATTLMRIAPLGKKESLDGTQCAVKRF